MQITNCFVAPCSSFPSCAASLKKIEMKNMWILKIAKWFAVEHGIRKLVDEIKKLISGLMEKMWSGKINPVKK